MLVGIAPSSNKLRSRAAFLSYLIVFTPYWRQKLSRSVCEKRFVSMLVLQSCWKYLENLKDTQGGSWGTKKWRVVLAIYVCKCLPTYFKLSNEITTKKWKLHIISLKLGPHLILREKFFTEYSLNFHDKRSCFESIFCFDNLPARLRWFQKAKFTNSLSAFIIHL